MNIETAKVAGNLAYQIENLTKKIKRCEVEEENPVDPYTLLWEYADKKWLSELNKKALAELISHLKEEREALMSRLTELS